MFNFSPFNRQERKPVPQENLGNQIGATQNSLESVLAKINGPQDIPENMFTSFENVFGYVKKYSLPFMTALVMLGYSLDADAQKINSAGIKPMNPNVKEKQEKTPEQQEQGRQNRQTVYQTMGDVVSMGGAMAGQHNQKVQQGSQVAWNLLNNISIIDNRISQRKQEKARQE